MHGTHNAEDDPGLATQLSCEPASSVRDVWERRSKHQYPEHPACLEEFASPEQEQSQAHDGDKDGTQPHHDVVTIIDHFDSVGTLIGWKGVESSDGCRPT